MVVCAAISAGSLLGTISYYQTDLDLYRADWRAAAAYVLDHAQPGDSVYSYQVNQEPFEFYRWQRRPAPAWPKTLNPPLYSDEAEDDFVAIPGAAVRSARPVGGRVWLLLPYIDNPTGKPDPSELAVRDWFASGRHRADVQRLPLIEVVLFADDGTGPSKVANNRP
jgi:hypothetical protein